MILVADIYIYHPKDADICPAKGANLGQATAIADKFIKARPEYWHLPAPMLIAQSLREVFPCPKN